MNEKTGLQENYIENSIHEAFIKAIKAAKHYVFIETQYLIGSFSQNADNLVFEAIVDRIILAHENNEVFRVYIIFPVQPDSNLDDSSMSEFMFWQWQTIHRNRDAVYDAESKEFEHLNSLDMEVGSFGGMIGRLKEKMPSKMMIVDDSESEISKMNGKDFQVRKFARDLRLKLWSQHLGLSSELDLKIINDPISEDTHEYILKNAIENSTAFETLFPGIPSNKYATIDEQITALKSQQKVTNSNALVNNIKGHLVHFPLLWLWKEEGIADSWRPDAFYS